MGSRRSPAATLNFGGALQIELIVFVAAVRLDLFQLNQNYAGGRYYVDKQKHVDL